GRTRDGAALFAAGLLVLELWVAQAYLGTLMVVTLIVMILTVLIWPLLTPSPGRRRRERFAIVVLVAGVASSLALYVGYKNRPGAYQGSPAFLMDPSQKAEAYAIDRIAVPSRPPALPSAATAEMARQALVGYARAL